VNLPEDILYAITVDLNPMEFIRFFSVNRHLRSVFVRSTDSENGIDFGRVPEKYRSLPTQNGVELLDEEDEYVETDNILDEYWRERFEWDNDVQDDTCSPHKNWFLKYSKDPFHSFIGFFFESIS